MATPKILPRHLRSRVALALRDTPVVLVNGPRQAGKSTLIRQFESSKRPYLTLDDSATLAAAKHDPQGFIQRIDTAVIDEVQRVPALLLAMKLAVDQDRRPGRFLITGSADVMALPRVADSLAGRIEVLSLLPLAGSELQRSSGNWLALVFEGLRQGRLPVVSPRLAAKHTGTVLEQRVLQGGYPEVLQRGLTARRDAWVKNYINAVLQRDVRDIAAVEKLQLLPKLLFALAQVTGQLCNYAQLGGQLGLDAKTVNKYVTILEQLFLLRRVPAWSAQALSRVVKTPKLQFLDSGLLCSLRKIGVDTLRQHRSLFGHVLETWVYGELLKLASWAEEPCEVLMYRDKDQVEVDFVLENPQGALVGVEVKAAASVQSADFAGLRKFATLAGKHYAGGILLYDGIHTLPMGECAGKPLWAVPLCTLWMS